MQRDYSVISSSDIVSVINARNYREEAIDKYSELCNKAKISYWYEKIGDDLMPPLIRRTDLFGMAFIIVVLLLIIAGYAGAFKWFYLIVPLVIGIVRMTLSSDTSDQMTLKKVYASVNLQKALNLRIKENSAFAEEMNQTLKKYQKYDKQSLDDIFGSLSDKNLQDVSRLLGPSSHMSWNEMIQGLDATQSRRQVRQQSQEMRNQMMETDRRIRVTYLGDEDNGK